MIGKFKVVEFNSITDFSCLTLDSFTKLRISKEFQEFGIFGYFVYKLYVKFKIPREDCFGGGDLFFTFHPRLDSWIRRNRKGNQMFEPPNSFIIKKSEQDVTNRNVFLNQLSAIGGYTEYKYTQHDREKAEGKREIRLFNLPLIRKFRKYLSDEESDYSESMKDENDEESKEEDVALDIYHDCLGRIIEVPFNGTVRFFID